MMAPRRKGLILSQGWLKVPHHHLKSMWHFNRKKKKKKGKWNKTKNRERVNSRQRNNGYFPISMTLLDSKIMFFYFFFFFNEMMAILLDGKVAGVWLVIFCTLKWCGKCC